VSDFTYVATWAGFVYLAFVIDAFARRIVGFDRLLHHSHVITIRGDSYRLPEKRRSGLLRTPVVEQSASPPA
jgi:transposase InsO family protein